MATADKLNQVIGYLLKIEANIGVAETLSNTLDGLNPYIGDGNPEAPSSVEYVFDGKIGRAAGTLAPQKMTTPNGKFRQGQLQVLFKGLGSAYSGSAYPPNEVHRALLISGFDATYSAAPSPQWLYTPTAHGTAFSTGTFRQFAQGSQYDQAGVLADWSFEAQGLGVPIHTFAWKGIASALTDVSLPAITLQAPGVIPPVASAVVSNLGAFGAATIRRVSYRSNRSMDTARIAQNLAGGHAGFVPGAMEPELELEIERPARATFDPEALMAAATSAAVDVTFGSTQYNRWKLSFPQAQLSAVQPSADGAVATVVLTYRAHASTPSANDAMTILIN